MIKKTSEFCPNKIYSIFVFIKIKSKHDFDMARNYELKWVSEEVWEQTPLDIQEKKKRFGVLQHYIKIRKKRIDRLNKKIKDLKLERIEWEKERLVLYKDLYSFQKSYIPSVNPTTQPGNNWQWGINLTIGNNTKKVYLGSNKKVREKVDEIKDIEIFLPKLNNKGGELKDELKDEIRKIIQKNLIKEMKEDMEDVIDKFENKRLKIWNYLY